MSLDKQETKLTLVSNDSLNIQNLLSSYESSSVKNNWEEANDDSTKFVKYIKSVYHNVIWPNFDISLLLLSQFFNSIMILVCKILVTDREFKTPFHPLQILFVRMSFTYICCILYMLISKSVPDAPFGPTPIRPLLLLRGVVGFLGVFGVYFSLQYLSLSDAVAITFLVPMVTAFLAWLLLHEPYSLLEGICSTLSLTGVILIAKPDFIFGKSSKSETNVEESFESSSTGKRLLATGSGLLGVIGVSSVYIMLRKIGDQAHPLLTVSYLALTCSIITSAAILALPSLSFVIPQSSHQWLLFTLIGISGFLMQFLLTVGIQRVAASKAAMITYTNMVFAIFWDLTFWGHLPGKLSVLGIIIIIVNTLIVIRYKPAQSKPDREEAIENMDNNEVKYSSGAGADAILLQDFSITDHENDNE